MVYAIETNSSVKSVLKKKEGTKPPKLYLNIIDNINKKIKVILLFLIIMPVSHSFLQS